MDHHLQSPEITTNHVTSHNNSEFSFSCAQLSTQVLPTPTGQSCSCAGSLQKQGICGDEVSGQTQETVSRTSKEDQNTSAAPLHVTWSYNCQVDNLCSVGWVVQQGTWEVSQYHWDTSALSNHNLWPFLTGKQRGFISYAFLREKHIFLSLIRPAKATSPVQSDILTRRKHLTFISASFQGQQHQQKPRMTLVYNSYSKCMNIGGKTTLLPCPNICIRRPRTSLFPYLKISTVPLRSINCKVPFELVPLSLIILFIIALVLLKSCDI